MPQVGFEPTIPVLERAMTFLALDRAAAVIGFFLFLSFYSFFLVNEEVSSFIWWYFCYETVKPGRRIPTFRRGMLLFPSWRWRQCVGAHLSDYRMYIFNWLFNDAIILTIYGLMTGRLMNWKGFGRNRSRPNRVLSQRFPWRGNPRITSVRIGGVRTDIRTELLLNATVITLTFFMLSYVG
jgi:hypothetical protein